MGNGGTSVQTDIGTRADKDFFKFIDNVTKTKFLKTRGNGKFFLIKYEYDGNRENEFLEYIYNTIPTYALKPTERKKLIEEFMMFGILLLIDLYKTQTPVNLEN